MLARWILVSDIDFPQVGHFLSGVSARSIQFLRSISATLQLVPSAPDPIASTSYTRSSHAAHRVVTERLPAFGKVWSQMHLVGVPAIVPGVIALWSRSGCSAGYLWIEKPLSEWLRSSWRAAPDLPPASGPATQYSISAQSEDPRQ